MSDLLQKAIVDAKLLRDSSVKLAESVLMEKFSKQIKEAVEQMLEFDNEEDMGLGGMANPGMEGGDELGLGSEPSPGLDAGGSEDPTQMPSDIISSPSGEETVIDDQVPKASLVGDDEEIEIDFSELEKKLNSGEEDVQGSDMADRSEVSDEIKPEDSATELPMDDMGEIDNEMLENILETLSVDYEPVPDGWLGTNKTDRAMAVDGSLAALKDDETQEELKTLKKSVGDLTESVKNEQEKNKNLIKENLEIKENFKKALKKMEELNLKNAKYYYANQVLINGSLNERQKKLFVEQIVKTPDTIEKTKALYETLVNSTSLVEKKAQAKSLNEVVSRPSMTSLLTSQKTEKESFDPLKDRMLKLAGINKKN